MSHRDPYRESGLHEAAVERVGYGRVMGTFVVGIDGSDEAADALRWTLGLAGADDHVRAVAAWTYPIAVGGGLGYGAGVAATIPYEEIEAGARAALDGTLSQVDAAGIDLTSETVMSASPSGGLITAAKDADLLVVGTRRHSTVGRVFVGSVAIQCAHHAPCAFVAVPAAPPPLGDVIAVAVDGSDSSPRALRWAAALATERNVRLRVISVWERIAWSGGPRIVDPDQNDEDRALDLLREQVEQVVPEAVDRIEYRPVHAEAHVASHLLEAAEGAGLLVMGSRGRGGFTGLLLGSVSQRCLESSTIPVAIIRN